MFLFIINANQFVFYVDSSKNITKYLKYSAFFSLTYMELQNVFQLNFNIRIDVMKSISWHDLRLFNSMKINGAFSKD